MLPGEVKGRHSRENFPWSKSASPPTKRYLAHNRRCARESSEAVTPLSSRKRDRACGADDFAHLKPPSPKRRRLRLSLTTSMLSRPSTVPSRYIPARRAPREGPWVRERMAGRDLLRKAAIFNKIAMKRRTSGMRGVDHRKLTRRAALIESCPHPTSERSRSRSSSPHPSRRRQQDVTEEEDLEDYEPFSAFDVTDVSDEEDNHVGPIIYSDFNTLRDDEEGPDADAMDDSYSFGSFDSGQTLYNEAGDKALRLLRDTGKVAEVSLAPKLFGFKEGGHP